MRIKGRAETPKGCFSEWAGRTGSESNNACGRNTTVAAKIGINAKSGCFKVGVGTDEEGQSTGRVNGD